MSQEEAVDPEHKIKCAYRILIGPWDDKTPSRFRTCQDSSLPLDEMGSSSSTAATSPIQNTPSTATDSNIDNTKKRDDGIPRPQPATIQAPRHNENCEPMEYNNTSGHTSSSGANVNYLSEDTFHTAQSSLLRGQTSTDDINDSDSFHTHVETNSISTTPTTSSQSSNNTIRPSHPKAITGVNGTPSASSSDDRSLTETAKQQNQQSSGKTKYCGPIPKITLNKSDSDTQQSPPRKSTKRPTPTGESRHTLTSSLVWRKSGPIFIPSLSGNTTSSSGTHNDGGDGNSADSDDDPIIKHGFLLCTEMVNGQDDKLPAAYKQRNLNSMGRYWRQLQVILTPEALECYDSRNIPWPNRKPQHRISLDLQTNPGLSLYILSPLDYTFCLQYTLRDSKEIGTVVFRARSLTRCQEWYMALYPLLPPFARKPFPRECEIYIPSINLRVHLPLVDEHYLHHNHEETLHQQQQQHGRNDSRFSITMDQIKGAVLDLLQKDAVWQSSLLNNWDLSLCWVRKDRLEWVFWKPSIDGSTRVDKVICPQLIESTHQLELRPIQHTPHHVGLSGNTTLAEPFPCEGFLTKITDFEGRNIKAGSWVPRRFYFSSFAGFLFAIPAHKARLPLKSAYMDPSTLKHCTNAKLAPSYSNRVKDSPLVTLVTPYAGNTDRITHPWQQEEIDRRMYLISVATGYINLAEVSYVQRSFDGYSSSDALMTPFTGRSEDMAGDSVSSGFGTSSTSPMLEHGTTSPPPLPSSSSVPHRRRLSAFGHGLSTRKNLWAKQRPCIELVMENGISLKLKAYSKDTCDQWVSCLSDLIIYAKARVEADRDIHSNGAKLVSHFDCKLKSQGKKRDGLDSFKCGTSEDANHPFVDTRIWSICPFTQCKDIIKSGIMYVQSKNTFSQKQFILTMDGRLHYYNIYKRDSNNGKPLTTGYHERKGTLDMANAYVYSGLASEMDWRTSKQHLDRPPRLFKNGMTAEDSDQECLLTVWVPKRLRIFSLKRQRILVYNSEQRFNVWGTRWLFLTPSRKEKEEWVWAINIVQEQLFRKVHKDWAKKRDDLAGSSKQSSLAH